MKCVIFAVLLAVMQAAPPVPRKTTDTSAKAPANIKRKSASSQEPAQAAPTSDKADGNRPPKKNSNEQHSENDGDSIVVRQLPAVTIATPRRDWADWGSWGFNLLLVGVGIAGIVVAVKSLNRIDEEIRQMRRQVDVTMLQLRAMNEQITQMTEQTTLLSKYVHDTEKIAQAAVDSGIAARESIILTHRPKIVVRGVNFAWYHILQRMTTVNRLNENEFDDGQLGGAFYMVNIGNQPATVIFLELYVSFDDQLPAEHPAVGGKNQQTVNIRLAAGQSARWPFKPTAVTSGSRDKQIGLSTQIYVIGKLTYIDELGNRRETGFCRYADVQRKSLLPAGAPDYEYAD